MFVAEFHDKREVSHLHQVAASERGLARHTLAIEKGAIAAAEIGERDAARLRAEQAMVPAHAGGAQPEVAVRSPADQEFRLAQKYFARLLRCATWFDEAGFHGILKIAIEHQPDRRNCILASHEVTIRGRN